MPGPGRAEAATGDLNWAESGPKPLKKVTDVRKLKFTKCHCLFLTCKFACEKKFPEIMYFSAYDFTCEFIEVKSILIPVGAA